MNRGVFREMLFVGIAVLFITLGVAGYQAIAGTPPCGLVKIEPSDSGLESVTRIIGVDWERVIPWDKDAKARKHLADFEIYLLKIPAKKISTQTDWKDRINPYGVNVEDTLDKEGNAQQVRFTAITKHGSLIFNSQRSRPNPDDIRAIVRIAGTKLTVIEII